MGFDWDYILGDDDAQDAYDELLDMIEDMLEDA